MSTKYSLVNNSIYQLNYSDGLILLYAPLADCVVQVSEHDIERITSVLSDTCTVPDEEAQDIVEQLTDVLPIASRPGYVHSVEDFNNFTILPTNRCNFSCSFCYSKAGRGKETLSLTTVLNSIDWFVKTCNKAESPLHLTFYGGGEPMLVWSDIVYPSLLHIENLKRIQDIPISVTLITNGSIIPESAIRTLRECRVDVVVSFEVLEDLQNIHRLHYENVSDNIRSLIDGGISPRINAVITEDSVGRLSEIITTLHKNFPSIDYISLEPVNKTGLSETFYEEFAESFFSAMEKGTEYGITVTCSALRNCDVTVDRYCAGELCLTPTGRITLCPCISSESQPGFDQWVYGNASESEVTINYRRLSEMLNMNLSSMPHCSYCYARYNCGGGCLNNYLTDGQVHDEHFCTFTRNFLKRIIRKRYDESDIDAK